MMEAGKIECSLLQMIYKKYSVIEILNLLNNDEFESIHYQILNDIMK